MEKSSFIDPEEGTEDRIVDSGLCEPIARDTVLGPQTKDDYIEGSPQSNTVCFSE
jgi:hypothetical protein